MRSRTYQNTFDLRTNEELDLLKGFIPEKDQTLTADNVKIDIPDSMALPKDQTDEPSLIKQFFAVSSEKLKETFGLNDTDVVDFINKLSHFRLSKSAEKVADFANGGVVQPDFLKEIAKELAYLYDSARLTKKLFVYGVGLLIVSSAASGYQALMSITAAEAIFTNVFGATKKLAAGFSYFSAGVNLFNNIFVTTKSIMTCSTDFYNYFFSKTPQPDLHKKFVFSSLLAGMTVYPNVYLANKSFKPLDAFLKEKHDDNLKSPSHGIFQSAQAISSFMQSLRSLLKIDSLGLNLAYRHDRTAPVPRRELLDILNAFLPKNEQISEEGLKKLAHGKLYFEKEFFPGLHNAVRYFVAMTALPYTIVNYIIGAFFAGVQTQGIDLSKEKNPFKSIGDVFIFLGLGSTVVVSGVTKMLLLSRAYLWLMQEFFNTFSNEPILKHAGKAVDQETLPAGLRYFNSAFAYFFAIFSVFAAVEAFRETKITNNEFANFLAGFFGAYGLNANDTKKTLDAFSRVCHKEYAIRNNKIDAYVSTLVGNTPEEFIKKLMYLITEKMSSQQIVETLSSINCKEDLKTAAASLNGCNKHPERYQKWLYEFLDGKNSNYLQSMLISLRAIQMESEKIDDLEERATKLNELLQSLLDQTKVVLKRNLQAEKKEKPKSVLHDDAAAIAMRREKEKEMRNPNSTSSLPGENNGVRDFISSCWSSFFSCSKQDDGYQEVPQNGSGFA